MQTSNNTTEPELASQQRQFLRYLRDPTGPLSKGANQRAMGIYAELVYRNIASFIERFFPVCAQVCDTAAWQGLIREFIAKHPSKTPYFLSIAEEFLQFLLSQPHSLRALPPFLAELAHYEWVELALDIAQIEPPDPHAAADNPWDTYWQLSPLAWCLAYQYPVHLIGPNNPNPAPQPSAFVVYRDRELMVKFMALTPATASWLNALDGTATPRQALNNLLTEVTANLFEQTDLILHEWIALEILLPVKSAATNI